MPLISTTLEQSLKGKIKLLEPKLKQALNSKTDGLYKAQVKVDLYTSQNSPQSGFDIIKFKHDMWQKVSDEWSTVIAKEIIKILADDISKIIADSVTTYIKTATIIVPPGQAVSAPPPTGIGVTTSPTPPANIT